MPCIQYPTEDLLAVKPTCFFSYRPTGDMLAAEPFRQCYVSYRLIGYILAALPCIKYPTEDLLAKEPTCYFSYRLIGDMLAAEPYRKCPIEGPQAW